MSLKRSLLASFLWREGKGVGKSQASKKLEAWVRGGEYPVMHATPQRQAVAQGS